VSSFLQLSLALVIIILAAKAGGWISVRVRQPAVLGELLAGLVLGPTLIDLLHLPFFDPAVLEETVFDLAELGVVLLMFVAGMEVDLQEMRRAGRAAFLGGVLGVIVPLAMGAAIALPFGYQGNAALFVGIILTATSVSISAQTLLELGVLRTREGITLLGAAVVDDVLVIVILSIFLALTGGAAGLGAVAGVIVNMLLYLALAVALGWLALPRLARWVDRQPISEGLAAMVLTSALLFAWAAEVVGGLAAITGAFIAGAGLSRSALRDKIEEKMRTLTYAFLVPIFFVSIGLHANAREIAGPLAPFLIALLVVAVASKLIGSGLGALWSGFSRREALRVGIGMISRGEVGLIVASIGVREGVIEPAVFSVVVILVLLTTLVTPILLRAAFPRVQTPGPSQSARAAIEED
jgi:Kef-type K+ transport system membrane component KefB